jgi:hypothetical protein
MDANANLSEQRKLVLSILKCADAGERIDMAVAERLAELVQSLDAWITNGGYLPLAWNKRRVD